jgi:hypothetical protein
MSQTDEIEYVARLTRPPLIPEDPPIEIAPGVTSCATVTSRGSPTSGS